MYIFGVQTSEGSTAFILFLCITFLDSSGSFTVYLTACGGYCSRSAVLSLMYCTKIGGGVHRWSGSHETQSQDSFLECLPLVALHACPMSFNEQLSPCRILMDRGPTSLSFTLSHRPVHHHHTLLAPFFMPLSTHCEQVLYAVTQS